MRLSDDMTVTPTLFDPICKCYCKKLYQRTPKRDNDPGSSWPPM